MKKTKLKNGLRIITVPQKSSKAVTILVLVGTGSKYEKEDIKGISHFLEHMFFKGTKKRKTPMDVVEPLDEIGGVCNAFTSEDYTGYYAKVNSSNFDLALDWVSDIYLNSTFPKREIEKERGVIIEEINMYSDTPMSYIGYLYRNLLYKDQPAGWDILGTKESVLSISREQLKKYRQSQYVSNNTIVCVTGNIDNDVEEKIKRVFSKIKTTAPNPKEKVIEEQSNPEVLILSKKTDQAHLALGVRAYNIFHPQRFALSVLAIILGGMMTSRLFVEVREKLGMSYYIKTYADLNPDTGTIATFAGIDNNKIYKGIEAIIKEYKKISQQKVSSKELDKAKNYFKGKLSLALESSDNLASFYAEEELLSGKIFTPSQIFSKIDKITREDILNVSKDIFKPEKLNLAIIGPYEDQKKFEKILKL